MNNIGRELNVLADLSDDELASHLEIYSRSPRLVEYERSRRKGDDAWTEATIQIQNPLFRQEEGNRKN